MATTLSMLVLRGKRYYTAHVGDSRVYRLRGEHFEQLTTDHVWDRPDMRHVLKRAIGLDQHLSMDYADGDLQENDRFLLVTDGVWEPLGEKKMHELLHLYQDSQRAAEALVAAAHDQNRSRSAHANNNTVFLFYKRKKKKKLSEPCERTRSPTASNTTSHNRDYEIN